ncbi:hypothetical protein Sta7437_2840 [Stanieria cyanosphaera PCC 7437]|uniref:Uncharacterized protein n=1 Tax=Stanieria cyanosphaera (strain ATCC 29371 / PCC 7437) TaxID=111780 RepID=K9XWA1_STAC7|nr:hypothetical protein [Stanieria cyanosphaera]AFZ36361.1 hypothetical protein Sta7437_2840 [Stanieria cyanosphaera PCC 7437]
MISKSLKRTTIATTLSILSLGVIETNQAQAASLFLGKYADLTQKLGIYLLANFPNQFHEFSLDTSKDEQSQLNSQKKNHTLPLNQNIQNRYQGLIEKDTEQTNLIATRRQLISEDDIVQTTPEDLEQTTAFLQSQGIYLDLTDKNRTVNTPIPLLVGIFLLISSPFIYSLISLFKNINQNIIEEFQDKFGNPKVPEGTVFLHDRSFKELLSLARKAERVDSEKFGSEEFLLFLKFKKAGEKGTKEEQQLHHSVELLRVAIATKNSFLRVEQTELRYRSTKQQEFYQFVLDTIGEEPDKDKFRDKVKKKLAEIIPLKKLAEIIPLLNTEEGRDALQSYLKEVNIISEHEFGLKLFALFKQYQLADFTILKTIAELVNQLQGYDLLAPKKLVILVIENYQVFEKLAPIIGIYGENQAPEDYVPLLQYIGLINRYQDAYTKFKELIKILKQWQKPYHALKLIREEYTAEQYRIPPEFTQEIPGLNVYKKYEKYVE